MENSSMNLPESGLCPCCGGQFKGLRGLKIHFNRCKQRVAQAALANAQSDTGETQSDSNSVMLSKRSQPDNSLQTNTAHNAKEGRQNDASSKLQLDRLLTQESSAIFDFSNSFFSDKYESDSELSQLESSRSISILGKPPDDWLSIVKQTVDDEKLSIFQLNLNSFSQKFIEIKELLDLNLLDIVFLSETKIDDTTPNNAIMNPFYKLIRRDRTSNGGGILVYYKSNLTLSKIQIDLDFELISFKIALSKNKKCSFLLGYRPPSDKEDKFLDNLESKLLSLNLEREEIFILGDLNYNLLSSNDNKLKEFMKNYNFSCLIKEPTRVFKSSATLLDVVLHNSNVNSLNTVISFPFSDHKIVTTQLIVDDQLKKTKNKKSFVIKRALNERAMNEFNELLPTIKLDFLDDVKSPNDRWLLFKNLIYNLLDQVSPKKKYFVKKFKSAPWFDSELSRARRLSQKAYNKYNKNKNDPVLSLKYKQALSDYHSLIRKKKISYYTDKDQKKLKSRDFWMAYSSSVKLKSDSTNSPNEFEINGALVNDPTAVSDGFNFFFSSIKPIAHYSRDESLSFIMKTFRSSNQLKIDREKLFQFTHVDSECISKLIGNLGGSSSSGFPDIPTKLIKLNVEIFSKFLTKLINDCIDLCVFPDEWKTALVTPLYKNKGTMLDMNNYRAISILSPFSKIFEKVLESQLRNYFVDNELISIHQHGFRKAHSCESNLHEIISILNSNIDNKLYNLLTFIDFKKAFDLVDSNILLYKLGHYGLNNHALKMIENYLSNRNQIVKYNNVSSSLQPVCYGVPQGSILGPLLFTIFINDLPLIVDENKMKLFADDSSLMNAAENFDQLVAESKEDLKKIDNWCKLNLVEINWSKTKIMILTNRKLKNDIEFKFNNNEIEHVKTFKLLGVTLDYKLNFKQHINNVCLAANRRLYSIKKIFFLPFLVKVQFFKSFILPVFDYCSNLFVYISKHLILKLRRAYNSCIYKLFQIDLRNLSLEQSNSKLAHLHIFDFHYRICLRLTLFTNNLLYNPHAPTTLKNSLTKKQDRVIEEYTRITRSYTNNQIIINHSRTNFGMKTFNNVFARIINAWDLFKLNIKNEELKKNLLKNLKNVHEKINNALENKLNIYKRKKGKEKKTNLN